MAYYARSRKCFCELGMCLASSAHVSAFLHVIIRSLGSTIIARLPIPRSISPNRYEPCSARYHLTSACCDLARSTNPRLILRYRVIDMIINCNCSLRRYSPPSLPHPATLWGPCLPRPDAELQVVASFMCEHHI